jgi:tRNA threonylcarbamoyladenosine biosynthesis protein TsaE
VVVAALFSAADKRVPAVVSNQLQLQLVSRRATTRLAHAVATQFTLPMPDGATPRNCGHLVMLSGDVGCGKTFFARALCRHLGVPPDVAIPSPTYNLMLEYQTDAGLLLHCDFYRLSTADAASTITQLDLRARRAECLLLVVEWGGEIAHLLGDAPALTLHFRLSPAGTRSALATGPLVTAIKPLLRGLRELPANVGR